MTYPGQRPEPPSLTPHFLLVPVMTNRPLAPEVILQLLRCGCSKAERCSNNSCQCRKAGLKCTDHCTCSDYGETCDNDGQEKDVLYSDEKDISGSDGD